MLRELRDSLKKLPVAGPALHQLYLFAFHQEGRTLTIQDGYLRGAKFRRFMHTYHHSYVEGNYESDLQAALVATLRPGQVFYDVGSNIGFMTLLAAKLVGPHGQVVAFEPGPKTAKQLAAQIKANGLRNVLVQEAAVSNQVGMSRFETNTYSVTAHLTAGPSPSGTQSGQVVRTTTLDHFITTHPVPHVLKIDVEGAEIAVIRGARRLLSDHRPILIVELHSEGLSQEFHQFMREHHYQMHLPCGAAAPAGDYNRFVIARPQVLSAIG